MKAFVIQIYDIPESVAAADRCIVSAADHGVGVMPFPAVTPDDDPEDIIMGRGWSMDSFQTNNRFSRWERMLAAFCSHSELWIECAKGGEDFIILEHDAVFVRPLPDGFSFRRVCNLGRPSFGGFKTPRHKGVGPMYSKAHLPGAHAYAVSPRGARDLIAVAREKARPTDVFVHKLNVPLLEELYPWPVECRESFTTIQTEFGCKSKHRKGLKIL